MKLLPLDLKLPDSNSLLHVTNVKTDPAAGTITLDLKGDDAHVGEVLAQLFYSKYINNSVQTESNGEGTQSTLSIVYNTNGRKVPKDLKNIEAALGRAGLAQEQNQEVFAAIASALQEEARGSSRHLRRDEVESVWRR